MTLKPNRIAPSAPLTPGQEVALARELLEIRSEAELDHFLPLLAAALPMITNIAGPLLKNVAGSLFGGGSGKKKRPRDQQEQFLGGIVKGLLGGEMEYEQEQFLGGIFKGLLGGEMEYEQERFLGGIIGKLFGGKELEAENYVQEQFLGGIVKGLLGGEMESETAAPAHGHPHLLKRARRFVRLVNSAATHAATEIARLQSQGHRPTAMELRRIVLAALVKAAQRFIPRIAAIAFPGEAIPAGPAPGQPHPAAGGQQTMLEMMIAGATPLGASRAQPGLCTHCAGNGRANGASGYPLG